MCVRASGLSFLVFCLVSSLWAQLPCVFCVCSSLLGPTSLCFYMFSSLLGSGSLHFDIFSSLRALFLRVFVCVHASGLSFLMCLCVLKLPGSVFLCFCMFSHCDTRSQFKMHCSHFRNCRSQGAVEGRAGSAACREAFLLRGPLAARVYD